MKNRRHRNRVAVERTLAYLRRTDRLLPGDDATVAIVRSTAELLDDATVPYERALAARVHIVAVGALLAGHPAPTDDADDRLIAALRGIR